MSVAKVIATVGGVALKPGVSANRRWYTPEIVADAVTDVQKRLAAGETVNLTRLDTDELSQLTHHAGDDDSTRIVGRLTGMSLDEDGNARFTAAIADTPHGRTIASLLDTSDGQPAFLKGVSIRGYWTGTVRKVKGPDGQPAETGSGITLAGLDYTKSPGVAGAGVDTFAWADRSGRTETTERILITESVQEARVTITEQTPPAAHAESDPAALAEAVAALLPLPHVLENGICLTCEASPPMSKRGSGLTGAGRQWADPGYQKDGKQRYDISTKQNAKSAWAYVNQPENAKPYTPGQLKRIKGKIKAALKRFGVTVAAESADWGRGETWEAAAFVSDELAEHYGDPSCSGSWSVSASNGPVNLTLCSYGMDPEDLDVILRAAADAACKALAALDPDMDGDVDVPGVGDGSDPDDDAPGETAPDGTGTDPAASPAAATTETEDPAMAETTTTPAETAAPGIDPKALAEAMAVLDRQRQERKAAKKAARKAEEAAAAKAATETAAAAAAAQAAANAAPSQGIPATAGATATETADQRMARLQGLADRKFAEAAAREGLTVTETDEQILDRMLEEKLVPLRQARAEQGGVQRKGIAKLEELADSPKIGKELREASNEELKYAAAAAYGPRSRS